LKRKQREKKRKKSKQFVRSAEWFVFVVVGGFSEKIGGWKKQEKNGVRQTSCVSIGSVPGVCAASAVGEGSLGDCGSGSPPFWSSWTSFFSIICALEISNTPFWLMRTLTFTSCASPDEEGLTSLTFHSPKKEKPND
jgi:cytochrome bd-type quinol oxidase subunit 2